MSAIWSLSGEGRPDADIEFREILTQSDSHASKFKFTVARRQQSPGEPHGIDSAGVFGDCYEEASNRYRPRWIDWNARFCGRSWEARLQSSAARTCTGL